MSSFDCETIGKRTQLVAKSRSVYLLINGLAQWVLVAEKDVELL
jgi:hypothetical protein